MAAALPADQREERGTGCADAGLLRWRRRPLPTGRKSAAPALLALAACGFQPVYGPGGSGTALQNAVQVDAPDDAQSLSGICTGPSSLRSGVFAILGPSGAGKSTIASAAEQLLHEQGFRTYILDGDNVRHGLTKDLGFTVADRVENIRRISEVAKLMVDAGIIVLTAFISPYRAERDMAKSLFDSDDFLEVFVDTTLAVAEGRDPKGLYKKARRGELPNFTGIDSDYEPPQTPDLTLDTNARSIEDCAKALAEMIMTRATD